MQEGQPTRVLVLDNGAHSIKAAWADPAQPSLNPPVTTFRNAISRSKTAKRNYVADQLESECDDFGGLTFRVPFDHGILNNWDVQKTVWDRVYGEKGKGLAINPQETNLLLTEPVLNLPNVQEHYDQIVFEEYDFASYLRCPAPSLVPYGLEARGFPNAPPPECALVIDSGFSFTHIVPVLRGRVVSHAVKRIDVGGKLLTNYLKELVSFRHWYMMDQTSVMEHAKEKACYVSTQWDRDWELATRDSNNPIVRTYVLPDFIPTSTNKLGYVRTGLTPPPPPLPQNEGDDLTASTSASMMTGGPPPPPPTAPEEEEQLLHLCNERFSVPEVLFTPSTIDMNQAGIAETVAASIALLPDSLQGLFWSNIVCVGGNVAFEGFAERLRTDLRSFAPQEFDVNVTVSAHPITAAASAAASYLSLPPTSPLRAAYPTPLDLSSFVTRQEYQEQGGSNACRRKFGRFYLHSEKKEDVERCVFGAAGAAGVDGAASGGTFKGQGTALGYGQRAR